MHLDRVLDRRQPGTTLVRIGRAENHPIALARQLECAGKDLGDATLLQRENAATHQRTDQQLACGSFLQAFAVHEDVGHEYAVAAHLGAAAGHLVEQTFADDFSACGGVGGGTERD